MYCSHNPPSNGYWHEQFTQLESLSVDIVKSPLGNERAQRLYEAKSNYSLQKVHTPEDKLSDVIAHIGHVGYAARVHLSRSLPVHIHIYAMNLRSPILHVDVLVVMFLKRWIVFWITGVLL